MWVAIGLMRDRATTAARVSKGAGSTSAADSFRVMRYASQRKHLRALEEAFVNHAVGTSIRQVVGGGDSSRNCIRKAVSLWYFPAISCEGEEAQV